MADETIPSNVLELFYHYLKTEPDIKEFSAFTSLVIGDGLTIVNKYCFKTEYIHGDWYCTKTTLSNDINLENIVVKWKLEGEGYSPTLLLL